MRPAIDPLFRSAARAYGSGVIGVVLSGTLDDGTAGLSAIKQAGGLAIVQDPATALFPGMPSHAIEGARVDHILTPEKIGAALTEFVAIAAPAVPPPSNGKLEEEFQKYLGHRSKMEMIGKPSIFTCPECQGTLWEAYEHGNLAYHCRVGHSYSAEGLLADHDTSMEASLWAALRSLEENANLKSRLAERMREQGHQIMTRRLEAQIRALEMHADQIRRVLENMQTTHIDSEDRAG